MKTRKKSSIPTSISERPVETLGNKDREQLLGAYAARVAVDTKRQGRAKLVTP